MASRIELTAPPGFFDQSWQATFEQALFDDADTLGQIEQFNAMSRTPVLTGALVSDVSYRTGSKSSGVLVEVYSGTMNQIDEYSRVYDIYQEGGILGAGSNSGPANHQMYGQVLTTDIDAIVQWGEAALQRAADAIAAGKGVKL